MNPSRSRWSVGALIGFVAWILASGPATAGTEREGVVVEAVRAGHAGARAGLRAGDVLLSWERGSNPPSNPVALSGRFARAVDVRLIEWEQSGRGPLRLIGRRGREPIVFAMPGGDGWGIEIRPRLEARQLETLEEARGLLASGDALSGQRLWRQAVEELAAEGRLHAAAWLQRNLATALADRRDVPAAIAASEAAIELAEQTRDFAAVGFMRRERALIGQTTSPLEESREAYQRVHDLWADAAEAPRVGPLVLAVALNDLGLTASRMGDPARAAELFGQSLALRREHAPGSGDEASSLLNLATVSPLEQAGGLLLDAKAILARLAPEGRRMTRTLNNLAKVAYEKGYLRQCVEHLQEALRLARLHDDGGSIGFLLANLSEVSQLRGDLAASERFSQEAADLIAAAGPRNAASRFAVDNLLTIGGLARNRGDLTRAKATLEQALDMERALGATSARLPAIEASLAQVALDRGEVDEAGRLVASAASRPLEDSAYSETISILIRLAEVERGLGRPESGLGHLERALGVIPEGVPESLVHADLLTTLGEQLLDAGQIERAKALFERALAAQKERLPGTVAVASSFHGLGRVQWQLGERELAGRYFAEAVAAVETQRGRMSGDYESRARFNTRTARLYRDYVELAIESGQGALAFALSEQARARAFLDLLASRHLSFAEIDSELDAELEASNVAYDRALARVRQIEAAKGQSLEPALQSLADARARRNEVLTRIRTADPKPVSWRNPRPLDADGAHRILGDRTLLVSFLVSREKTFLFTVGPGDRPLGVHVLPLGEGELRREVKRFRRALGPEGTASFSWPWARRLGEALLGPVRDLVSGAARVLIVPDGPLHDLPFAALSDPSAPDRYLIEGRPLSMALSVTNLAEIRSLPGTQGSTLVVAFGDPAFGADRGQPGLQRLSATRREVQALGKLFPASTLHLGEEASESRAKSLGPRAAILHFASHGIADDRFPLESALALSRPSPGRGGEDNGLLQAWEIFEQIRIDAELVTLSACETGSGEELAGEGLIGLTRAFQFAGARSVLASLWPVADGSTAQLMTEFYRHVRDGMKLDEALRSAQASMIAAKDQRPFHWAAFQIHGDAARSIRFEE